MLQKKDADTWKMPSDRTPALSSSVMATKLSGVSDEWKVPTSKHNNGLALDSSAFRPPAEVGSPLDTTSITNLGLYSSHSTIAGIATDTEDSTSSSEKCLIRKSQKRRRSPSAVDVTPETRNKFLTTSSSQCLAGSTPSLTAVDEAVYNVSRQQFSSVDISRRRVDEFSSHACSLLPLCHEYPSLSDVSRSLHLLPSQDVAGVHTTPTTSAITSMPTSNSAPVSCVIPPVAPSPYLPFFTSTPSSNISGLYYPSPYVMLSASPFTYQQTAPHFPCGWISSVVGGAEPTPSKFVAEHMHQFDRPSQTHQQLHRGPPTSAAFDFPWMRGNPVQTTQVLPKASPQMCDLYESHLAAATKQSYGFNQYMFMRNVSSLGATLASDGLEMCRQPSCDLPSSVAANRMLLDNHPTSYLGIYPPLFHPPYLGIPSR